MRATAATAGFFAAFFPLPAFLSLPLMLLTWAVVILIRCLANASTISLGPAPGWASRYSLTAAVFSPLTVFFAISLSPILGYLVDAQLLHPESAEQRTRGRQRPHSMMSVLNVPEKRASRRDLASWRWFLPVF